MWSVVRFIGWAWVALCVVVLWQSGGVRTFEMLAAPDVSDPFARRYVEHPVVGLLHFGPGLLFVLFAPLQFSPTLRRRHLGLHRRSGRILVVLAAVSGIYALLAGVRLPAYAGSPTLIATLVFGVYFLTALGMGVTRIRQRRVAEHREWMIRVFAIAIAVATIRAVVGLIQVFSELSFEEAFGPAFWIGFTVNALAAEAWIRAAPAPAGTLRRARR